MFFEAQVVTQEVKRADSGFQGHVYLYRVNTDAQSTDSKYTLTYKSYDDFMQLIENNNLNSKHYFTVDNTTGEILVAEISTTTIETEKIREGKIWNPKEKTTETTVTYKPINYKSIISQYTTPMSFFVALGMNTRNPNFLEAVTLLVKDSSKIELTIIDTKTTKITEKVDKYTEHTIGRILDYGQDGTLVEPIVTEIDSHVDVTETTTTTVETLVPTLKITSVDTWICSQDIKYSKLPTEEIEEEPQTIPQSSDSPGEYIEDESIAYSESWTTREDTVIYRETFIDSYDTGVASEYVDNTDGFINLLDIEYTVPNAKEKRTAGAYLKSDADILFSLLLQNTETQGMEQVMRYIMQKYTGEDYGADGFSFSIFDPNYFTGYTGGIIGDTIEDKVWYSLRSLGLSEYVVAGVMGNIKRESEFDPTAENSNGAYGLCQWLDRRPALEAYANSKETTIDDVNTQIEFLIGEITPGGGANGHATFQMIFTVNGYSYESWKNADNIEDSTKAFCYVFERAGDTEEGIRLRIQYANDYYEAYQGKASGSVMAILQAADDVARYLEENNYTYLGTEHTSYTFPIENNGKTTISCSSYLQQCLLKAGYTQLAGAEKLWAYPNSNVTQRYFTNAGIPTQLITNMNELQPGDIVQYGTGSHVVIVYSVNGNNITVKGVPEVLNGYQGFYGATRTIEFLESKKSYAFRIVQ